MFAWLAALKLQPLSALMLHVRSKNVRKQFFFLSRWQGLGYLTIYTSCKLNDLFLVVASTHPFQPCQLELDQQVYIYRLFMFRTVYSLSDLNPQDWPNWWLISSYKPASMQTKISNFLVSPISIREGNVSFNFRVEASLVSPLWRQGPCGECGDGDMESVLEMLGIWATTEVRALASWELRVSVLCWPCEW